MADTGTPSTTISLETISGQITAAPHNNNYGAIETAFEAHTHDLTTDCVGDTELDAQRVRSIHATKKYALVSGKKAYTASGTDDTATITFATDAAQGDPAFSAAPYVVVTSCPGGVFVGVPGEVLYLGALSATSVAVNIVRETASTGIGYIYWFAYGEVA